MAYEYKFLSYDPFLSFCNNNVFFDLKHKAFDKDKNYESLFIIGKRAFELLEVKSATALFELIQDYFLFIEVLIEILPILKEKGHLTVLSESKDEIEFDCWLKKIKSSSFQLIENTPSLLDVGYSVSRQLTSGIGKEKILDDLRDDIRLACLIHTLIQIDIAIVAYKLDSNGLVEATKEATSTLALAEVIIDQIKFEKRLRTSKAKFAALKRHEATNSAKQKIREIWGTGKYTSRDICAEQECAGLNLSFTTARKALINTPNNT
jgi:hypothetical protein